MKETRLVTALAIATIAGVCSGKDVPAPAVPPAVPEQIVQRPAPSPDAIKNARARLADLRAERTQTTLLCGTSLQYPFYHFAVLPRFNAKERGDHWNASFGLFAECAQSDSELAVEVFRDGAEMLAEMEDDETRQELVNQFQMFGEQIIDQTCQEICAKDPAGAIPYLKKLVATKAVTAKFGDKMATLPSSPLTSVRPEFIGQLVRKLQPVLTGDGARALESTVIDFLAGSDVPPDVRDALLDTLLTPAFTRAEADAGAFRKLLADAKQLRKRMPNDASKEALDQRIMAFGERTVEQTYKSLTTNATTQVVAYLKKLAETKALTVRFGNSADLVTFPASEFAPLKGEFVGRVVTEAYPRFAGEAAPIDDVRVMDDAALLLLKGDLTDESKSALLNAFLDKSVARAQNGLAGARQFVDSAEKIRGILGEGDLQKTLERRCQQFARKSTVKTFRAICPKVPDAVMPYLQNLADTRTLRLQYDGQLVSFPKCSVTAIPIDLVGQITEDAFIRFAGTATPGTVNTKMINTLLDFSAKLLPKLSEGAQQSLLDRRLDGFFLTGNYDGAIALLDKGLPSHTPGWCKGTAAKLRYHRALKAGQKADALKQLLIFIDFMLSDEQKDFEDCDPTTGIIYSREWVVAKNYLRCWEIARDIKDAAREKEYFQKAKDLYATALKKAKDDPKALAELKKETQAVGL